MTSITSEISFADFATVTDLELGAATLQLQRCSQMLQRTYSKL